jgi:type I restriction enzyme S subunit
LRHIDTGRATRATHIANKPAKLDALHSATERTIALLKEGRAAVISAAVTGQIDVNGTAARL